MIIGVLGWSYSPETEEVRGGEGEESDLCPGMLWMLIMLSEIEVCFIPSSQLGDS